MKENKSKKDTIMSDTKEEILIIQSKILNYCNENEINCLEIRDYAQLLINVFPEYKANDIEFIVNDIYNEIYEL